MHFRPALLLVLALCLGPATAQTAAPASLQVSRPDGSTVTLTAAALAGLAHETFSATGHDKTASYSGTDLRLVLRAAGVDPPEGLRGAQLRRVLLVQAADGYAAVFSYAELDATIGNKRAYLVDRMDGAPLSAAEGPLRLVVPAESRPTRWVRQVDRLAVVELK